MNCKVTFFYFTNKTKKDICKRDNISKIICIFAIRFRNFSFL